MPKSPTSVFPSLPNPPLAEVVCGVVFQPLAPLDILDLGRYQQERQQDFPFKTLQPPLADGFTFSVGEVPTHLRLWMESPKRDLMLQLQNDRFYLNWRAGVGEYPGFDALVAKAQSEFEGFRKYCGGLGLVLNPVRVEVSKINMIHRGRHWNNDEELRCLIPQLVPIWHDGVDVDVVQRASYRLGNNVELWMTLNSLRLPQRQSVDVIRLEISTRKTKLAPDEEIHSGWLLLNKQTNEAFFQAVSPEHLDCFSTPPPPVTSESR
jgi:uncharacterized protein (TIGR04255 family)